MSLKIIGSGFGRTGTRSLKEALEQLGFGPCHHMEEVFNNPNQVPVWQAFVAGERIDWHKFFAGYNSQIDWPGSHIWRELSETFPDAKVIHSVRPEDSWWKSFSTTIGKLLTVYERMELPPHVRDMLDAASEFIGKTTFNGQFMDREMALAAFRKRALDVQAALPADRLLVFDVAQGWDPLCNFLEVPVPDGPFPHLNELNEFWERVGGEPD
ncbi:sulfotransferase family protein [Pseudohalocynthiibacter aestuariivivens]|jgi:Sulfotransferase domain|uniref:Sulfotransferase family protein n=1 Tax=Pseudohalocynthiibacter aestuariivivens TaxID=1591409 RepID=A0ABV5JGJ1_9RHOB|nr:MULTISPECIES: sulfotransferase family protein [Pseudohalocynthiibacter]MBS9716088.1 hypothetical protein [Pseudohalocynthiibacter aestuariivivens]MCK0101107.1 hypothetical protein [Pseudohalocynthiibacter sp. F2068]